MRGLPWVSMTKYTMRIISKKANAKIISIRVEILPSLPATLIHTPFIYASTAINESLNGYQSL
jgi:hypothetical protein